MSLLRHITAFDGYNTVAFVLSLLLMMSTLGLLIRGLQGKVAIDTNWNALPVTVATLHAATVGLLFLDSLFGLGSPFKGQSMMIAVVGDALLMVIVAHTERSSRAWRSALFILGLCTIILYASLDLM